MKYIHIVRQPSSPSIPELFSSLKTEVSHSLSSDSVFLPAPSTWQPPFYFLSLWIWLLSILHVSGIIEYVVFRDWLILPTIKSSRFVYAEARVRTPFLFKAEWCSVVYVYCILFIHSSVDRYLDCFLILGVVNNVAMSMSVQISFWLLAFSSLEYIPRSGSWIM